MRLAALILTAILTAGVLAGCGTRPEYSASEVSFDRRGWDSLEVGVQFVRLRAFGDPVAASPDSFEVRVFSASFDTLFVGHDSLVVVPDARLDDRERALIEACGYFGRRVACGQQGFEASPKRIIVEDDLEYPEDGDYDLGRYSFGYSARRQVFGDSTWEQIRMPDEIRNHLAVRVVGERGEPIEVALDGRRGRFKLTNLRHNADFRRDLLAQLLDADEATVRFELYTSAFSIADPIWVKDAIVESKTEQTRELEAGYFVEEAGSRLLDLLRTFPVGPNIYLFMDNWTYDREERRYQIDFSLSWQSSFLRSRWFELSATLDVSESGADPVVRLTSGNERGVRRWEQRFDSREVELERISPRPAIGRPASTP